MSDNGKTLIIELSGAGFSASGIRVQLQSVSYEPPRKPWNIDFHCHNSYEIHFITSGEGTVHFENSVHTVKSGMFYITGPDVFHAQTSGTENSMEEYCLNAVIEKNADAKTGYAELMNEIIEHPSFVGEDDFGGGELCEKILEEMKNKKTGCVEKSLSLTNTLLISMGRAICEAAGKSSSEKIPAVPNRRRILDSAFRKFKDEKITAEYLAGKLYVSPRQVSRIVREEYGMTMTEKINSLRTEYAKRLLTEGVGVERTAALSGYSSPQYFIRVFKKYTGISPGSYRKNNLLCDEREEREKKK